MEETSQAFAKSGIIHTRKCRSKAFSRKHLEMLRKLLFIKYVFAYLIDTLHSKPLLHAGCDLREVMSDNSPLR